MIIKCNLCQKSVDLDENLTKTQLKTLQFIQKYFKLHGKCPSFREIQKGLNYKTPSAGYEIVMALVDKQFLAKTKFKKRSLIITKEVPCEIS